MRTFVLGMIIGAAIALLLAPEPGESFRERLKERTKHYWDEAQP